MATRQSEVLVDTDFEQGAAGWVLNGNARLLRIEGRQILSLTQNQPWQASAAWYPLPHRLTSFRFIADLRIRFDAPPGGGCPADGAAMVFARADTEAKGTAGHNLGLFEGPFDTFASFEISTWRLQGLAVGPEAENCHSGKHVTFAFDLCDPSRDRPTREPGQAGTPEEGGAKIGQTLPPEGMTLVNDGWYRYEWHVDGAAKSMTVYVTGLEASNQQFQNVKVLEVRFPRSPIDFEGRFGFTAATGGAVQHTEVAAVRIESLTPQPR
jgi:hypothetical protein